MLDFKDKRFFLYKHLLSYAPQDENELGSKKKFIALLEDCPNCFERDSMPGHVVGSAILVDDQYENILLTHHRKIGMWFQFGGHADGDSNPFNVALRETIEESGITEVYFEYPFSGIFDIDVQSIPEYRGIPKHFHYDIRILLKTKNKNFTVSNESKELRWVGINEVEKYNSQKEFIRLVNKVRNCLNN